MVQKGPKYVPFGPMWNRVLVVTIYNLHANFEHPSSNDATCRAAMGSIPMELRNSIQLQIPIPELELELNIWKKNGIGIGIGIEPNSVNSASIPFELFFNPLSFFILNIRFSSHFLHFKNESTGLLKPVLSYIFHSKKCTCYKDESQYCTAWPSFIHTLGSVYIYM